MSPIPSSKELFEKVLFAIDASGWRALILDAHKPFLLRLFNGDDKGFDVRIYIWNCTHGGGSARAIAEARRVHNWN
jgi:putative restriction endonuclease